MNIVFKVYSNYGPEPSDELQDMCEIVFQKEGVVVIPRSPIMYYFCGAWNNDDLVGLGIASIYGNKSSMRSSRFRFKENIHRELWIEFLWSEYKGCGTKIMDWKKN